MMKTSEIFHKVRQYLEHEKTVSELEDWIVPRLVPFASSAPASARELWGTVELGLAEMSEGQISEDEFRSLLEDFLRTRSVGTKATSNTG
ncbi:MAG: hypothetical protein HYX92_06430 [Chloroflexi bacterium]|nr:hypothetical protein [Chloroflexota bacterium]